MPGKTVVFYQDQILRIGLQNYRQGVSNMPTHRHSFLTISLLLKGSLVEQTPTGKVLVQPGALSIKPAGVLHSDIFTEDCTILSMNCLDWSYFQLDYTRWEWLHRSLAMKHLFHIIQAKDKKLALVELKQFIFNHQRTETPPQPVWLKQVHQIVTQHFRESLPIHQLAKEVGVHPVHLGRSFRKSFGIDIKSYQRQLRVHYAMSEAMNNRQNLTQIAYDCGFADQSHFSREFKKMMNISPKKVLGKLGV